MKSKNSKQLEIYAHTIAQTILDICYNAGVGHIGSCLSITDILTALYFDRMQKNDRFILSKGHAGGALYAALYHKKVLTKKQLFSYAHELGGLCEHPESSTKGVEMTSGSLGYGIGFGSGMALALKKTAKNSKYPHVFVLISDGECGEGSIWEATLFAVAQKIDNLTVIVDNNGWQCFGKTQEILGTTPLLPKFQAFGFAGVEVDGHDLSQLTQALHNVPFEPKKPSVIIANTTSGHGVSLFEDKLEAHYQTLNEASFKQAKQDIQKRRNIA